MNAGEGERLVRRYLDDRDSLDDRETAALVRWLEEDPERVAELRGDLVLDELLSQMHAVDRRNFPAQVRQRVADWMRGEQALDERAAELRALAAGQLGEYGKRRSGRRWIGWTLAIAAMLACVLATPLLFSISTYDAPRVASMTGTPWIVRDQKPRPLNLDERLRAADRLEVDDDSSVELVYDDGTEVALESGTEATLIATGMTAAKRMELAQGELIATVSPQRAGSPMTFVTPHSEVRVLGTELLIDVDRQSTRLEVRHGRVEFRRTLPPKAGQPQSTIVKTDQSAVSASAGLALEEGLWPARRIGLAFLHAASAAGVSFDDPETGEPRLSSVGREGRAWLDPLHRLNLDGGRFVAAPEDSATIAKSLARSGSFSLETAMTLLRPAEGETSIVRFGDASGAASFELLLRGRALSLAISLLPEASDGSEPAAEPTKPIEIVRELGDLMLGEPVHLTATWTEGRLHVFRDGALVLQELIPDAGSLHLPESPILTLGSSVEQGRTVQARLEAVAIYDRALDDREARRNALELRRARTVRKEPRSALVRFEPVDPAAFDRAWEEGPAKLGETSLVFIDVKRTGASSGSLAYVSLATVVDPRRPDERERLRQALLSGELRGLALAEMPELDRLPRGELRLPAEETTAIGVSSQFFIDGLIASESGNGSAKVGGETPGR